MKLCYQKKKKIATASPPKQNSITVEIPKKKHKHPNLYINKQIRTTPEH